MVELIVQSSITMQMLSIKNYQKSHASRVYIHIGLLFESVGHALASKAGE